MKAFFLVCFSISLMFQLGSIAQSDSGAMSEYSDKTNSSSEIVYILNEACTLISKKGEDAFNDFRVENSIWNDGKFDLYVIDESSGEFIVYPSSGKIDPAQLDIKNLNGKVFMKHVMSNSSSPKESRFRKFLGMVLNPEYDSNPASYAKEITAPSGKKYVVTASASNLDFQKTVLQGVVGEAADLIIAKGPASFSELRKEDSIFRFKDTYVFVIDKNGKVLVNPAKPDWENKNIFELEPDPLHRSENIELLNSALAEKSGAWVMGRSVSPIKDKADGEFKKLYFVKTAVFKGEIYIVGSGIYFYDNRNKPGAK